MNEPAKPADPKLVKKLTVILEQARRGELTGFVAVTFREGGAIDQCSEVSWHATKTFPAPPLRSKRCTT